MTTYRLASTDRIHNFITFSKIQPTGLRRRRSPLSVLFTFLALAALTSALCMTAAAAELIVNGDFSQFTSGGRNEVISTYNGSGLAVLQGWTNTRPFVAAYGPNASELIGASGLNNNLYLWGPKNGSNNGFTDMSPNQISNPNANFLSADADPDFGGTLTQAVAGLQVGHQYTLSYNWGAEQYTDEAGAISAGWTVKLGSQLLVDGTIGSGLYASIPSKGFSGWMSENLNFTYDGSGNILSFLATGSPTGLPPVALLDDVSLTDTPEPGTLLMAASGLLGLGSWRAWARRG
jgi:hypothetical protein